MIRSRPLRLVLALAALTLAAAPPRPLGAQRPTRPSPSEPGAPFDTAAVLASARPEIEAANDAWLAGLRRRDATAIAAAYADSGLFVGPDGTVTRGRAAVERMYAARFLRLREITGGGLEQDGMTAVSDDRVYEWGHGWLEMAPATAGAPPARSGGAYLTVWQREGDGHWRIVRNLAL